MNVLAPSAADLVVTNITSPTTFYSGTTVNVVATIANQGQHATTSYGWLNALYYSHSDHYDSTAIRLTTLYHDALSNMALQVGESYQDTFACKLPLDWFGETYLYVMVDASNSEYEYAGENNNMLRSSLLNVILTPPADLVVRNISIPTTISNSEQFTVSYETRNIGLGRSNVAEWYNNIYLSTSPELPAVILNSSGRSSDYTYPNIPDTVDWCYLLESNRHFVADGISAGASITTTRSYWLPSFINQSTKLYVIVVADANNNVFEYEREENNVGHSDSTQTFIYFPDFTLSNMQAPDTMVAGHVIDLDFKVYNNGLKDYSGYLDYSIYYSTDSVFAESSAELLTSTSLHTSSRVGRLSDITLPVQFSQSVVDSNYYLYLFVNKDSTIAEYSIQNNVLRCGLYYICHRTLPDLVLCNVTLSDTLKAGGLATLSFDVVNNGEMIEGRPANIYGLRCHTALMADDTIWCPVQTQFSPSPVGRMTLAVGDTLHYVQRVTIPPMARDSITFTLSVDASNRIQELNENNNRMSLTRYVQPTTFDLAVQSINAPDVYTTGDTVKIHWTTSMDGHVDYCRDTIYTTTDATGYSNTIRWDNNANGTLWNTMLVLSSDSIYSSDDRELKWNYINASSSDSIINDSVSAIMPHTLSGNLYLIAIADVYQSCIERTRANNTFVRPITANLSPQPNLVVTALSMDDTVYQKQGCMIHYTVTNQGEGRTALSVFSDEFSIGGTVVNRMSHVLSVAPGESYSDSVEVVIPDDLLGVYSVRVTADADNSIFENFRDDDNTLSRPIVVLPALPCDLVVASVSSDAAVIVGNSITINYVLQNIGENAVAGYVKDAFYLSSDINYDDNDVLLGTALHKDTLPAHGSKQHSQSFVAQNGLTEGTYYVIVRTNIMRAFNEVSFDNNIETSLSPVNISLPLLTIGEEKQFTMNSGDKVYYRLNVGPELAGKALSVSLNTEIIPETDSDLLRAIQRAQQYQHYESDFILEIGGSINHYITSIYVIRKEPHYIRIRDKNIFVGYKYIHVFYHNGTTHGHAVVSGSKGVLSYHYLGTPYDYRITYEPRDIPISLLVEHQLYSVNVSASCYNEIFGNSEISILNDNQSFLNGLYISHGVTPSPTSSDFSIGHPNDTSQNITISSLEEGAYYFMVNASSSGGVLLGARKQITREDVLRTNYELEKYAIYLNGMLITPGVYARTSIYSILHGDDRDVVYYILPRTNSNQQSMRLLARTVDFEIVDVNTAEGSNQSSVTTKVTGAMFNDVMDIRLENENGMIPPSNVYVDNPTEAYVTFDLNGATEGTYNVVAELPGGIITTKENAFVVGDKLPSEISVNIVAPAKVRVGQVTGINIDYSNNGASNLNVVGLLVRPSKGTYLSPTPNPNTWVNGDIFIRFPKVGGPIYGVLLIPWSNQNQAPSIRDVVIPSASNTPVSTPQSSQSSTPTNFYGGVYQTIPNSSGSTQLYTRPDSPGQGTIDVYPVYQIAR